ncbi:transcriptional regulator family: Fungal Specific TF [Penicillium atrosanguineum]|uniref:transcriptional regulator family: Fungal Specific TF n=1 Tax=Penicillium atrosanguineum TaxID=1132637 RepID=UPI0023909FD2|nr:transcriptional regulator family: Fungal Specific TF [Penicillium atrosanguineum]KAJ5134283.1 hypothetical protein N7526_005648 [Penicillium atrosanguineum]KAJ5304430.1 transcriptional regulator family: Fungal Specific TF [Penicillium atrosanguineum]
MEWDPSRFFRVTGSPSPYALLILNQPINESAFGVLSEHASYIICADGGANRLYDMMKKHAKEATELPDRIVGDLDSLRPLVRQYYEKMGVAIVEDEDQYSTDFTKCLKYLNGHVAEIIASPRQQKLDSSVKHGNAAGDLQAQPAQTPTLEIVILGGLGGRVDQAFSQIHHLYMMTQNQRELREAYQANADSHCNKPAAGGNLYLVSEESITFILQEGKNIIRTPATRRPDVEAESLESQADDSETSRKRKRDQEAEYFFEENIGIIPISAAASITTKGFEWDVQDWRTEIGGQISTSNHIRADTVEVETSVPVLFTVELAERLKR